MQEKELLLLLCEVIESLLTVWDKSNLEIITRMSDINRATSGTMTARIILVISDISSLG